MLLKVKGNGLVVTVSGTGSLWQGCPQTGERGSDTPLIHHRIPGASPALTAPERKIIIHGARTDELRHMVGPVTKPVDETLLSVCSTKRIGVSHSLTRFVRSSNRHTHILLWAEIWWKCKRRRNTICFYDTHRHYTTFMTPKKMKIDIFRFFYFLIHVSIQFGSFA